MAKVSGKKKTTSKKIVTEEPVCTICKTRIATHICPTTKVALCNDLKCDIVNKRYWERE